MCINIDMFGLIYLHHLIFTILYASHFIMVFKDAIENGFIFNKDINGLIADKVLFLDLLFTHIVF